MNAVSLFGLAATVLMLVCYALEHRSPWYVLGFAVACVLAGLYAFLQGAWPLRLGDRLYDCRIAALEATSQARVSVTA
jgi:hypothetical protein